MNKRKGFENIFLTIIFLVIIYYIITFILSFFKDIDIKLPNFDSNISITLPNIKIDTDYLLNKYLNKDNNQTTKIKTSKNNDINITQNNNQKVYIDDSVIFKITQYTSLLSNNSTIKSEFDNNKTIIINFIKIKKNKKIIPKKIQLTNKIAQKKKTNELKPSREIMLNTLRIFIKSTIIDIRSNAKLISSNIKGSIKIRLTVLKNGKYQNIKYLSGNKLLLSNAKIAVKEAFPRKLDHTIKSQFPRYIRFKIDF